MRIGIDVSSTHDQFRYRATGLFTTRIVEHFLKIAPENEYILFQDYVSVPLLRSMAFRLKVVPQIRKARLDVFLQPNFEVGLPLGVCRTVVFLHDLTPLVRDRFSQKGKMINSLKGWQYRFNLAQAKKADAVLTNSQTTKSDLVSVGAVAAEKITVTPLGIDPIFRPKTRSDLVLGGSYSYLLYVGGVEEHKNLGKLLEAFGYLRQDKRFASWRLVLVGRDFINEEKAETAALLRQALKLGLDNALVRPGFIEREKLPVFYSQASLFVYPSLYEGFGLPPLEAMACGVPVAVSSASSLPEVCGPAAWYFNPEDVQSIVKTLKTALVLTKERLKKIEEGRRWSRRFTWEKTASLTLPVLEKVASC